MDIKITLKDWERMQDLLDRDQDGEGVASKIKDANKAAARFVAGTILAKDKDRVLEYKGIYWSEFKAFGYKAKDLGATDDDLFKALETAEVPENFKETHVTKKAYTGYVGSLERTLDQLRDRYGVEIVKEAIEGYPYWSYETRASYNRNGRVWPLNYRLTFKNGDKEEKHTVIVVTNEGGGNYGYDFDCCRWPWGMIKNRLEEIAKRVVAA